MAVSFAQVSTLDLQKNVQIFLDSATEIHRTDHVIKTPLCATERERKWYKEKEPEGGLGTEGSAKKAGREN